MSIKHTDLPPRKKYGCKSQYLFLCQYTVIRGSVIQERLGVLETVKNFFILSLVAMKSTISEKEQEIGLSCEVEG
jgi:hypothetical protein